MVFLVWLHILYRGQNNNIPLTVRGYAYCTVFTTYHFFSVSKCQHDGFFTVFSMKTSVCDGGSVKEGNLTNSLCNTTQDGKTQMGRGGGGGVRVSIFFRKI